MEDLRVKRIGDNILEISLIDWSEQSAAQKWNNYISLVAKKIFARDDQTVIVLSPIKLADILADTVWSDVLESERQHFAQTHRMKSAKFKHDNDEYIITCLYNPPLELIEELVHHYVFTLSNMFLFKRKGVMMDIDDDLRNDFREVIRKNDFLQMPSITVEMIAASDDGCALLWFNANIDLI